MRLFLVWFLLAPALALGQEASGDIPPSEEKKLEWSGNLDAKYTLSHMAPGSAMYQLQFLNAGNISSYLSQYRIEPYLNGDYQTEDAGFHLKTHATYFSDAEASFDLFEAYGSYNPSFNSTIQAGKRVYSWGKGYAFNPVGYLNPIKDPENPELAQAGLLSANIEYIKSFSSPVLPTFSFLLAVIPPTPGFAGRYAEAENTGLAVKAYILLWDTDIDVMGYYNKNNPRQLGLDFSRNLREDIEIHGELSYNQNSPRYTIVSGNVNAVREDRFSYLLGLRYLHESNITAIAEYYHNSNGMNQGEFENYVGFLESVAGTGNSEVVQQALGVSQRYFRGSTLMRDYLYGKLIIPEPFEWLYFTPSLYSIYNLNDKSFLVSASLSYKPVTNVEFILWPTILAGTETSEFGGKMVGWRIEGWLRVFF